MNEAAFLAEPCYCGHTREHHRTRESGPSLKCRVCGGGHYFMKPEHREREVRQQAAAADPEHRHARTHTAYGCPGFVPFQVCDDCGLPVPS
jgi:hypothetical protein